MRSICMVFLPVLLLAISCVDKNVVLMLDEVSSYIHAEPDRARKELESIDRSKLRSRKEQARFSLLYTMALDKTDLELQTDSTIRPALEYYRHHGTVDDRIKSLYYLGIYQYYIKEYSKSIVTLTKAHSLLDKATDDRYCGLVNQGIADTHKAAYNDSEVMPYLDAAYDCFVKNGDMSLADLTLCSKAVLYSALHMNKEADSLFTEVLERGNIPDFALPDVLCEYAIALIPGSTGDPQKIEGLFSKALELAGGTFNDSNTWAAYAYILAKNGKRQLSESIFRQLHEEPSPDDVSSKFWESCAFAIYDDYESAYYSLKQSLRVQDSVLTVMLQNSTSKAQRDYFALQERAAGARMKVHKLAFTVVILLLLISVALMYNFFRRRRLAILKEKSELIATCEFVRRQLDQTKEHNSLERLRIDNEIHDKEEMLSRLKSGYINIYRAHFHKIGVLCETFLALDDRHDSYKPVYEKVKDVINDIGVDSGSCLRFEAMINESLDDVMAHIRKDFPSLGEEDYRFISYIIVGFDATTISVILHMPSQAAVYAKKSRIKKQILSSSSPNKEQYLQFF